MLRACVLTTLVLALVAAAEAGPRVRAVAQPPAAPAIGPELATADPVFGPSSFYESAPHIATGGGIGLVVWNGGQKAVRVDVNGRPLDVSPIPLLPRQHIASDVVFHDGAFTFAAVSPELSGDLYEVMLVRVTLAGEVSTRRLGHTFGVNSLALATNGRELLLGASTRVGIAMFLIDAQGALDFGPRFGGELRKLASDGTDFLALYRDGASALVVRIRRNGTLGAPATLALSDPQDLVWNGTDYAVLGLDAATLRGVRVSAAGVPGEAFLEIAAPDALHPSFSWTGSEYRLLWKQRSGATGRTVAYDAWTARAAASGQVIESVRLRAESDTHGTHVVIGSTDVAGPLMAWTEAADTGSGTVSNIVASAGASVEVVSRRANDQSQTVVAQNGSATLAVSVDLRRGEGSTKISIARVNADGTRAPGPGTILYPSRGAQDFPDAAWNGVDSWIVWREADGVFAARVDANGTLVDRDPIHVASGTLHAWPQIACGPSDCLVLWSDAVPRVRSMRLAPNGTLLDAQPLDHGPGRVHEVVRAGDDYAFTASASQGLVLTRLRGGSTTVTAYPPFDSALAWSGHELLVVWGDPDSLVYARLDAAGNLLGAPQVLGSGLFPAAIWTGRHFLVAFDEDSINGVRISRGGAIVDRFPLSIAGNCDDPALAIRNDGTIVVSYTRHEAHAPYWGAARNVIRFARD